MKSLFLAFVLLLKLSEVVFFFSRIFNNYLLSVEHQMSLLMHRLKTCVLKILFNITWLHLQPNLSTVCGPVRLWRVEYGNSSSKQEEDEQIGHSQRHLEGQDLETPPKINGRFQQAAWIFLVWSWLARRRNHHHLFAPVWTYYELKVEGKLYSERFLTLFNPFSDNPGVTETNSIGRSAHP